MAEPQSPAPRTDRSPWNWLLVIPIVVPLLTPIYNFATPRVWGFPAFYWWQFLFILLGVATTTIVFQMTRARRPAGSPAASAPAPDRSDIPAGSADPAAGEAGSDE